MRVLEIGTREHTEVRVCDEPALGNGANHVYQVVSCPDAETDILRCTVEFQNGPVKEVGVNGIHNEDLICIVIDRLEGFQSGDYACEDNGKAIANLHMALANLRKRTDERKERGVEGTNEK